MKTQTKKKKFNPELKGDELRLRDLRSEIILITNISHLASSFGKWKPPTILYIVLFQNLAYNIDQKFSDQSFDSVYCLILMNSSSMRVASLINNI